MPLVGETVQEYLSDATFSCLLYGAYGSGKTNLTASAQLNADLKDLLFVDVDPGLRTVAGAEEVDLMHRVHFDTIRELEGLSAYIKKNYPTTKTVVFDSVTEFVNLRLAEFWSNRKPDAEGRIPIDFRDYFSTGNELMKVLTNLRGAGYNIILTAMAKDEFETGADKKPVFKRRRPDLPPRIFQVVAAFVDYMWHTYKSVDGTYNLLYQPFYTLSGAETVAKTRSLAYGAKLDKLQRKGMPGAIQIGEQGINPIGKYPNLNTLYNLYKETLVEEQK